jgi:hypothetical protein
MKAGGWRMNWCARLAPPLALALAVLGNPPQAGAQVTPDSITAPVPLAGGLAGFAGGEPPADRTIDGVTPRGALLRSFLIPGWGQAATGSPGRGGFFLLAEAGSLWMLAKTQGQLRFAADVRRAVESEATARFLAEGVSADSVPLLLDADEGVEAARGLEGARKRQREDWVALGLFVLLLGGVDAFVSAHLQDFPEPLTVEPVVGDRGTRLEVGVSLPWRGPGGG